MIVSGEDGVSLMVCGCAADRELCPVLFLDRCRKE
jgi:hypothetical protein